MLNVFGRALRRRRALPVEGFFFGRPLVVLQSDDWGRVGIRDGEGWEELRSLGVNLGERNYDFYSLETAEDIEAIVSLLSRHRDSNGRPACLGMNFIMANVDFAKVVGDEFRQIHLRSLAEGLPDGWKRPGLFEAYHHGISAGVLSPELHGTTHFCRAAAQRYLNDSGERGNFLRMLWRAGVPYIYWRMPWMGFEYLDPGESGRETFLASEIQDEMIAEAVKTFAQLFSKAPRSACAPGYRADRSTHQAWEKCGVQVAQNGPGSNLPPHFEVHGDQNCEAKILHLYRTLDFEPSASQTFSLEACVRMAEDSFARRIPAIVSVHSINFHSTLKDFRSETLTQLDKFLTALESKYPDLLYVRDQDLYDLVDKGQFESMQSSMQSTLRVPVTKRTFKSGGITNVGKS
ncbi:MAG: hypothetical protein WA474_08750 [Candidatus Sulfotelmatobacter sp.]